MSPRKKNYKGSICLLLIAILFLISCVRLSSPVTSTSMQRADIGLANSFASTSNITMLGADAVAGRETQAFVENLASQGLKWNRECLCYLDNNGTPTQAFEYTVQAGIKTIGLIPDDPETYCGSGVLQAEATYKAAVQKWVNEFPSIHNWEYGNEVNSACPASGFSGWNIGPSNYFIGLVWAYQVITSTSGHASDTMEGPTETIWTTSNAGGDASCYDNYKLSWFKSFWSQNYQGYSPQSVLTWVDLHVYTDGMLWNAKLDSVFGSSSDSYCGTETVSQMIASGLNAYYSAEGRSKPIIISETGYESGNTTGGYSDQATWYNQMVPFYASLGFIKGVFAYELHDTQGYSWGLFDSSLNAKPAWYAYQSYLSGSTSFTTTSSTLTNPTSTSVISASTTTSDSTTQTSQTVSSTTLSTSLSNSNSASSFSSSSDTRSSRSSSSSDLTATARAGSSTVSDSALTSLAGSILGILSFLSPFNDPTITYGLATYQFCLIGVLVFTILRSRKRGTYNLSNQGQKWWSSIPKALFSWTETGHLLPQSTKQFGFYENAATRGINAEGYLPVRKYRRSNAVKRQTERTGRQRKARATKASKDSKDILNQASEKKDSQQKRKKRASKKVRKDIQ